MIARLSAVSAPLGFHAVPLSPASCICSITITTTIPPAAQAGVADCGSAGGGRVQAGAAGVVALPAARGARDGRAQRGGVSGRAVRRGGRAPGADAPAGDCAEGGQGRHQVVRAACRAGSACRRAARRMRRLPHCLSPHSALAASQPPCNISPTLQPPPPTTTTTSVPPPPPSLLPPRSRRWRG